MASSPEEPPEILSSDFYPISKKLVRDLFEKKFKFKKADSWKLPPTETLFPDPYVIESLQNLKNKLNTVKSKLNDYPIEYWSAHTRRRNPSGEIAWRLKSVIEAEFVTQAWCKFYECLHQYPVVDGPKVNSVHLCEAPGAFIAALNHYLHSNYSDIQWQWLASTLNPYYEGNHLGNMVIDDRFMLHTLENWIFGKDFTGNVMSRENVENMIQEAAKIGEINLVTADGSIDCMEMPECQEEVVSSLHYAETCAALGMLSQGGNFVLKMFTLFQATSVSLIYLLNCLFDDVNVFKPATSKCGNSEVYVLCIGFKRNELSLTGIYSTMLGQLGNSHHKPIFGINSLPADFMQQLETCARMFMYHQIRVIEANISSYENNSRSEGKRCKAIRDQVAKNYFNRYNVQKILEKDKILYVKNASVQYCNHSRIYTGSFTERMSLQCKSIEEKLAIIRDDFVDFEIHLAWPYDSEYVTILGSEPNQKIHVYYGKPIVEVVSSLFIDMHLMHRVNKIRKVLPGTSWCFPISISMASNELPFKNFELSLQKSFNLQERNLLRNILDAMLELKPNNVVICNLPLLTHFSVSFFALLLNVYEEISFDANRTITLSRIQATGEEWLLRIQTLLTYFDVENILCLVNIKELHGNLFSQVITNYNNQICMHYCRNLLDCPLFLS